MTHPLSRIAREITLSLVPPDRQHLAVGMTCKHPDGRTVRIVSGCYLDPTYGRLSNHWHWREVLLGGLLAASEECGYGWFVRAEDVL